MTSGAPALTSVRNFRATSQATLAVSNSSGTVTIANGSGQDFEFKNVGTAEAFVQLGTTVVAGGTVSAETGGLSIPVGGILMYNFPNAIDGAVVFAGITASGSTVLRVTQGTGS